MQQEKLPQYKGTQEVLEFLGMSVIGDKQDPCRPFSGRAMAKVIRNNANVDMVAVMYDTTYERPYVIFDPNCNDGLISEYVFIYTYDWDGVNKADDEMKSEAHVKPKSVHTMKAEEVDIELMYVHGLTEEAIKEYKTLASRKALIVQKRDEKEKNNQAAV